MMSQLELVPMIYGLGLMGLCGISFGMIHRCFRQTMVRSVLVGLVFSVMAILAMQLPVQLREGIILDARAVMVGLASAFGGVPAAILSAVIVGLYRLHLGGMGAVAGAVGILASAVLGQIWRWRVGRVLRPSLLQLAGLGGLLALQTLSTFILPWHIAVDLLSSVAMMLTLSSIVGALIMGSLIERERRYILTEDHWRRTASTDSLTGLPNRRAFTTALAEDRVPVEADQSSALMIMDIDHFKKVNDTYGHDAGDEALRAVAEALRQTAQAGDRICRLGGEEFAIYAPTLNTGEVRDRANQFRIAVSATSIRYAGKEISLTASIGVAQRSGRYSSDTHAMMQDADLALYKAKASGRNCVSVIDDPFHKAQAGKLRVLAS